MYIETHRLGKMVKTKVTICLMLDGIIQFVQLDIMQQIKYSRRCLFLIRDFLVFILALHVVVVEFIITCTELNATSILVSIRCTVLHTNIMVVTTGGSMVVGGFLYMVLVTWRMNLTLVAIKLRCRNTWAAKSGRLIGFAEESRCFPRAQWHP